MSSLPGVVVQSRARHFLIKFVACCSVIFFSVAGSLLADVSRGRTNEYTYDPLTVPPVAEFVKMVISLFIILAQGRKDIRVVPSEYVLFAVPAFCHLVCNSCMFFIILDIGLTQYQLLSSLKIYFNAIFMRIFLGTILSERQWLSLIILAAGLVVAQLYNSASIQFNGRARGYVLVVFACLMSSIGGVYSEKLLKGRSSRNNIHWANAQLYSWGFVLGLFSTTQLGAGAVTRSTSFFHGYDFVVISMIGTLSLAGISVSFILKYLDTVFKSMVTSLAIVLTAFIQTLRGREEPSLQLAIGITLISFALKLYKT